MSLARSLSLASLIDRSMFGQFGSTFTIGVTPSPNFHDSLKRFHSRYVGISSNSCFSTPSSVLPYLGCSIIQWALRW